ncbi:MAG TPA: helix-turn-helix domain-containing protein [Candidatus Brocadiia bacterium]|nr:helix-turn-helix domain-containing protein [Candidatus Brocadiia bacterium]
MATALVQSLTRGLDALQAVAQAEQGLRLSEIATALGLKAPTAHNIVRTLAARGFLQKRPSDARYGLGPAVMEIASGHRRRALQQRALAAVQELYDTLKVATVTFAEPVAGEMVVRLRMSPDRPGVTQEPLNQTFHHYSNASGLAYLAFCSPEERNAVERRYPFAEYGAHIWKTPADLETFLTQVRGQGYATPVTAGQRSRGVAAPILGKGHEFLATIGASALVESGVDFDHLARLVVQSAERLSEQD